MGEMREGSSVREKGRGKSPSADLQTLNFKVPDDFKRAYKVYAAQRGMTMLDLLREGFELSKQEHKGSK
ncbi:hypothetical protein EGM87_14560 [Sphingobium sp. RSMS]|nr:hypothetical protein EGM87_14560 [Sphingobium sp. RSMS]